MSKRNIEPHTSNSSHHVINEDTLRFSAQEKRQGGSNQPIVFPSPQSGQRVRLRGGKQPYSGYLELLHSGEWGFVCDDDWNPEEADIVCKELGFLRGVASTTQVGITTLISNTFAHSKIVYDMTGSSINIKTLSGLSERPGQ